MNTKTPPADESNLKYIPFSNSTEFEGWHSRNCQQCQLCNIDDSPTCPGDEALTLALFDDGEIDTTACDYIGTTRRETQDNDYSFCTLNRVCNHFLPRK